MCTELVKDFQKFNIQDIPRRELISQETSDAIVLSEYQHDDLVLSSGALIDISGLL